MIVKGVARTVTFVFAMLMNVETSLTDDNIQVADRGYAQHIK
jgi:hypothetical protein